MKPGHTIFCFSLAFIGTTAVLLRGEQAVIEADRDNTIFSESTNSAGAASTFIAGRTNGGALRRSFLHFDVAGTVPADAAVTSASLVLHLDGVSQSETDPRDMSLHRVTTEWGEGFSGAGGPGGGQGAPSTVGDATWLHSTFDTGLWSSAGGDFSSVPSAVASVGTTIDFYQWASTADLVADVQGWLDDPTTNFGWALLGDETRNGSARRFNSREGAEDFRPVLTLDFTVVPEPSSISLAILAWLLPMTLRRSRRSQKH